VAKGCNQEEEIEYNQTLALVVRLEAIGMLLAFASGIKLYTMGVNCAFLNGYL